MRIVVTGGSGKAGRWVVRDLREHGYDVLNVDLAHDGSAHGLCVRADLTDLGQAIGLTAGADAIVHLAAVPAPKLRSEGETFRANTLSTYNVFSAAAANRVGRVVWASSETVLGLPFDAAPPAFAPVDETITPRPESSNALSKLLGEEMARQFARRAGIPFVGLRISNIMEPADYAAFPGWWRTRSCVDGTCGATWTPGTSPRPRDGRSRPACRERRSPSPPPPTRSCRVRPPSSWRRSTPRCRFAGRSRAAKPCYRSITHGSCSRTSRIIAGGTT